MFIIGFPTDDENSIMKTINYAKKLNTTFAQFSVWTPYPGTPVFKEYENRIIAKNLKNLINIIWCSSTMTFTLKKLELLGNLTYITED